MAHFLYAVVNTNLTDPIIGCPSLKELLYILFWSQTNTLVRRILRHTCVAGSDRRPWRPQAIELATQHHFSILPTPLVRWALPSLLQSITRHASSNARSPCAIRLMLSAFRLVQCNSRSSLSAAAVLGVGTAQEIYASWACVSPLLRVRILCSPSCFMQGPTILAHTNIQVLLHEQRRRHPGHPTQLL